MIDIWQPRWHDRRVLIAKYKVVKSDNLIRFTKAPTLSGKVFCLPYEEIVCHPIETNGSIDCYSVPLGLVLEKETSNV